MKYRIVSHGAKSNCATVEPPFLLSTVISPLMPYFDNSYTDQSSNVPPARRLPPVMAALSSPTTWVTVRSRACLKNSVPIYFVRNFT